MAVSDLELQTDRLMVRPAGALVDPGFAHPLAQRGREEDVVDPRAVLAGRALALPVARGDPSCVTILDLETLETEGLPLQRATPARRHVVG